MRKLSFIIPVIILLIAACTKVEKDVNNYYPEVRTVSAEQLPDGTVKITGEIIREGNAALYYVGFCMDTMSGPVMLSNQKSVDTLNGNKFSAIYSSLTKSKKYYFKAWCANGNGYAIADNEVSIDSVTISSSIIPCTLPLDTLTTVTTQSAKDERLYNISPIEQNTLEWGISLYTYTGSDMHIHFAQKPISGVYKTSSNNGTKGFYATVLVNGYLAEPGDNIYVEEISGSEIQVTICDATVYTGVLTGSIKTKFRASY